MNRAFGTVIMMIIMFFGFALFINAVVVQYNYVVQYHKDHPDDMARKNFDTDNVHNDSTFNR